MYPVSHAIILPIPPNVVSVGVPRLQPILVGLVESEVYVIKLVCCGGVRNFHYCKGSTELQCFLLSIKWSFPSLIRR